MKTTPQIVLASSSIYRKSLLARLQIPFVTSSPDINETPLPSEKPKNTALRLAINKAKALSPQFKNAIIIGSDQVAECEETAIGKPLTFENALKQLQFMRGKDVYFHTAVCTLDNTKNPKNPTIYSDVVTTTVTFRNLSDEELSAYLLLEKPFDCAGSAKNEALGITILEKIESTDPTALTGLPLITLTSFLRQCGIPFFKVPSNLQ